MKKREKYKDQIIEIMVPGDRMGLIKGELVACLEVDCKACDIFDLCAGDSEAEAAFRRAWAEAEAK